MSKDHTRCDAGEARPVASLCCCGKLNGVDAALKSLWVPGAWRRGDGRALEGVLPAIACQGNANPGFLNPVFEKS
jgi:hypothetical protein